MNCGERFLFICKKFQPVMISILAIGVTSLDINILGVPDTMSCTNQFMPDVKEIAKHFETDSD